MSEYIEQLKGTRVSWDFETDPEFQAELDWVDEFIRTEVEPVDQVIRHAWDMDDPIRRKLILEIASTD